MTNGKTKAAVGEWNKKECPKTIKNKTRNGRVDQRLWKPKEQMSLWLNLGYNANSLNQNKIIILKLIVSTSIQYLNHLTAIYKL